MKILIVKTSSLGDIIHCFPVLNALHETLSDVEVDWVVERRCSDLIHAHPLVSRVYEIDSRRWRSGRNIKEIIDFRKSLRETNYDVLFDLQGNVKSALVTMMARAKQKVGFGWKTVAEWPNVFATRKRYTPPLGKNIREDYLYPVQRYFDCEEYFPVSQVALTVDENDRKRVQRLLQAKQLKGKKVLVCPGTKWPNKQLSEEAWTAFLQRQSNCSFLFLWGTEEEKLFVTKLQQQFAGNSVLVDRLPLPALQYLMSEVDLVVAVDSLPLHLAGTTETPTFSVFGPSSARKYAPLGEHHRTIQGECPYGKTFEKRCPILRSCPTGACRLNKVEELL